MALSFDNSQRQGQSQRQGISQTQRRGLEILAMDLPALRAEIKAELARNPVLDPVDSPFEAKSLSAAVDEFAEAAGREEGDFPDGNDDRLLTLTSGSDAFSRVEDDFDRRQSFFDRQTAEESLAEHLRLQLPTGGFAPGEIPIAELLVGNLDGNGYFAGSFPDLVMATGLGEGELRAMLRRIARLDPPGCGATSLAECLAAQVDSAPAHYRDELRELVTGHLEDLATGRRDAVMAALGVSDDRLDDLVAELKALEPRPGRAFANPGKGAQFVNPEIHAVKVGDAWIAFVDQLDVPEFRFNPRYVKMLEDATIDEATKAYVRERLAAANEIRLAIANRRETIRLVAQEIFDAQPGFFERGLAGLVPLTQDDIAERIGVSPSTVSRTVNGKYVETPRGIVELRCFFVQGVATAAGGTVSRLSVESRLKELVDGEDKSSPLSDEKLAALLKTENFDVARRTVAKYRGVLGIPSAKDRKAQATSR